MYGYLWFFLFDKDDHLQTEVKEDHLCVSVLLNLTFCQVELVHDSFYVAVMYKRREFNGEIALCFHLVVQFRLREIADVVLSYLLLGVLQEMFLSFPSYFAAPCRVTIDASV